MKQPDILNTLRDAQLAHSAGDFVNSLTFYEHFFDHALDDDPYALYGVRLSYCLDGWGKLAEDFPGAHVRLSQKLDDSLDQYKQSNHAEKFHDYYCISKVLDLADQALIVFCELYNDNPKNTEKLARYVWDDLIRTEQWSICGQLLLQPEQKIDEFFSIYDEAKNLKTMEASFDNSKFDQHIIDTLLNGISNVVQVLRYNKRATEIETIERQFYLALKTRNDASLSKAVHAKASFLFIGH